MKQTVVEWLVDEMNSIKGSSTNMNGKIQFLEKELNKLYEQAKEMEKEQNLKSKIEAVNHFCKLNGFADTNMHKSVVDMYEKQMKK